jgi:hypothetical protein
MRIRLVLNLIYKFMYREHDGESMDCYRQVRCPADCGVMPQRIGFSYCVGWLTSWTDCCKCYGLPRTSRLEFFPSPRSIGFDRRLRAFLTLPQHSGRGRGRSSDAWHVYTGVRGAYSDWWRYVQGAQPMIKTLSHFFL